MLVRGRDTRMRIPLVSISLVSLAVIGLSGCGDGFKVENGRVAYESWNESQGKVTNYGEDADPRTFQPLDHDKNARAIYARDARHVFMLIHTRPVTVEAADPASFTIFTIDGVYAKDNNRVYYWGVELKGADPSTFRVLQTPFSRDSKRAFVVTTEIPVHKIESFEVVHTPGVHILPWGNAPPVCSSDGIKGSSSLRPEPYGATLGYSRDGISYYLGGKEIKGVDYKSFVVLNERYAKDKNFVYYLGDPIADADPASFQVVGPTVIRGCDKNHEYVDGKHTNAVK